MLRLMAKNSFYFIFYALVWVPVFILAVILPGRPLDTGMVYFDGMWIIFVVMILGAFLFVELVLVKSNIDAGKISAFINSSSLGIWIALGLGVLAGFFGMMSIAIKAKKRYRG